MIIDRIHILINLSMMKNIEPLEKMRLNLKLNMPYINNKSGKLYIYGKLLLS